MTHLCLGEITCCSLENDRDVEKVESRGPVGQLSLEGRQNDFVQSWVEVRVKRRGGIPEKVKWGGA